MIALVAWMYSVVYQPNDLPQARQFGKLEIEKGENLARIAAKLDSVGLVNDARRFVWACRIMRVERGIPAGIFTIPFGLSNRELIKRLLFQSANTADVTIREGWTAARIARELQREVGVDSVEFMNVVDDSIFAKDLGLEAPSLEGYLYPETYNLYLGMDPREVARKMVVQFRRLFGDELKNRAFELGFSVNQIITLASIIEGEIIFSSEAPIVSGVYHNRLKKGMRLQADPTIQYIIPDGPRRLRYSDLKINSPYNTYRRKGLPPGPVGNPGKRAILAALFPANVPYIYFVARGDGYHYFNVTAEEHLADKRKFDRYRRQVRQNMKKALP